MYLNASFRDGESTQEGDFSFQLRRLYPVVEYLSNREKLLGKPWYLRAESEGDSSEIPVFDESEPQAAAIQELTRRSQHESGQPKIIDIWNGFPGRGKASTFSILIDCGSIANRFEFTISEPKSGDSRLGLYEAVAKLVAKVVIAYDCPYVTFGPRPYFEKQVFGDRPGVSWMLYLPHTLTTAQVPEARALIPVMRDSKQQGTIIVSVTNEVFDVSNRDHVKVANDIEIRLADQDLLPRYVDL
ncbi:immunity 52 family protein [Burkholderia ubonensis]|uniref:immunity 52 family protein n=1 Tax=Burkholderia ubonensis TaxID=101571 RepID=UPI000AB0C002|nr:immunity 52 family protein [Burkholderia ubonensis]